MGQYYKPINLENNESLLAHDYDNGLKLMEHSWLGNKFVGAVENLLMVGNGWYKKPIVWAGDYADPEKDDKGNDKVTSEGYDINLYNLVDDKKVLKSLETDVPREYKYIVNHTKKEYVNKNNVPKSTADWIGDSDFRIHPLPLLTCEGNGRGGGDFHGGESPLIGSWARDVISIEKKCPFGFKKLNFDLIE